MRVQTGQQEVDAEEDAHVSRLFGQVGLRGGRDRAGDSRRASAACFGRFVLAGPEQAVLPLRLVLDVLDPQEAARAEQGEHQAQRPGRAAGRAGRSGRPKPSSGC